MTDVLFNLNPAELETFVTNMGQPRFRAKQIAEWILRGAPDFASMKNIPESLRNDLDKVAATLPVKIVRQLESSDGQTTKFLLELADGEQIESVLMRTSYGNSVCVSSQAGCAMGCKFCASTLLGLKRNLTVNEMLAQVLIANWQLKQGSESKVQSSKNDSEIRTLKSENCRDEVTHIVVMGTGEPLMNTENLIGFLERANRDLGISWRKLTVSTCGIVPGIQELTKWGRPINLAISLHAPTDELRGTLMPINNKFRIEQVLAAAFENSAMHNRQLMIEYILLATKPTEESGKFKVESLDNPHFKLYTLNSGFCNYTEDCALKLVSLLQNQNVMVNLIPWNAVDERDFTSPSGNAVHRFQDILIKNGIHTRIRRERGQDIGSACGQLRLGRNV